MITALCTAILSVFTYYLNKWKHFQIKHQYYTKEEKGMC